jgi:hypothetical protein
MKRAGNRRAAALAACAIAGFGAWASPADAQQARHRHHAHAANADYTRVLHLIQQQERRLDAQQHQLADQQALIDRQRRQLAALSGTERLAEADLGSETGAGLPSNALGYTPLDSDQPIATRRRPQLQRFADVEGGSGPAAAPADAPAAPPSTPVGEAPPEQPRPQVQALPEEATALQQHGRLTLEPTIEYDNSSSNRLVFRGVEIVTGIQIGLIDASDTNRDTVATTFAARYALTDRLEIEGRVPFLYRHDRVTTLAQQSQTSTQTYDIDGSALGDIEGSIRYQLNDPKPGGMIYVAGLRLKSDTGLGPYDVKRDSHGVAQQLATGSGFWAAQGSLSFLYPSDPVVLFGNISYLYNASGDVNKDIGTVHVGQVNPGDAIGFGFGMGFALNPRFSYSLGYSHEYIMPTETVLNGTRQQSESDEIGTLDFGMSFRETEQLTLATNVDIGVTADAPDIRIAFRTPFTF